MTFCPDSCIQSHGSPPPNKARQVTAGINPRKVVPVASAPAPELGVRPLEETTLVREVEPEFAGQVVKLLVDGPDGWQWWSLDEPQFESHHGRVFLVGGLTDPDPSKPFRGRTVRACIAWDGISVYYTEAVVERQKRKFGGSDCNTVQS